MSNRFFIIVLVGLAIVFGVVLFNSKDDAPASKASPTNHVLGEGTSGVTLIEYGDFQCPACGAFFPVVQQVKAKYGDQITFQFRHFPLIQIHRHALLSSRAAEAAGKQGKFFEMHDLLYQSQTNWTNSEDPSEMFVGFATQLELDEQQFRADLASQEINDIVLADVAEANAIGATSTPTFVLDGKKLDQNPGSLEDFFKIIDEAIASKQQQ